MIRALGTSDTTTDDWKTVKMQHFGLANETSEVTIGECAGTIGDIVQAGLYMIG